VATKEQIWTAADVITSEGGSPTLAAVREKLGGGSYTDISAAMQQWRTSRQSSSAPMREPAPTSITERMTEFSSEIWAAALEMANTRLQSEREALEQARREAEETRQEAADLADQLAADLDKANSEILRLNQELLASTDEQERLQSIIKQYADESSAAKHRADIAEAARSELQERIEQLTGFLERAQNETTQATKEATELRIKLEMANNRVVEMETRSSAAEQMTEKLRQEAGNARIAEQTGQVRLESATREIEILRADKTVAEDRYRKAMENAAMLQGRLDALNESSEDNLDDSQAVTTAQET
jgi:chromosome segregation ATPase